MRFKMAILGLSWILCVGIWGWTPTQGAGKGGVITGTVVHSSVKRFPTVVYIEEIPDRKFQPPAKPLMIDQRTKEFTPRILPVLAGTTVHFHNSDGFEHNVNSPDGEEFDLGNWGKGQHRPYTFKQAGVYTLLCRVHPEMVGYAVVTSTPYFAVTDLEGNFRISDVPAGSWKLKVWNERLKPKQIEATFAVMVDGAKEAKVEIKP